MVGLGFLAHIIKENGHEKATCGAGLRRDDHRRGRRGQTVCDWVRGRSAPSSRQESRGSGADPAVR